MTSGCNSFLLITTSARLNFALLIKWTAIWTSGWTPPLLWLPPCSPRRTVKTVWRFSEQFQANFRAISRRTLHSFLTGAHKNSLSANLVEPISKSLLWFSLDTYWPSSNNVRCSNSSTSNNWIHLSSSRPTAERSRLIIFKVLGILLAKLLQLEH